MCDFTTVPGAATNQRTGGGAPENGPSPEGGGDGRFEYGGKAVLDAMALARNYNNRLFRWISEGLGSDHAVLDFGAGTGEFANRLEGRVTAVEPDTRFHRLIRHACFSSLDEVGGPFDLIYAVNVLEHLDDDARTVRRLGRLLRPGGRLKVLVPAFERLRTGMDDAVGHVRRYERNGLVALLEDGGLRVTRCTYFDSLGYLATLVYRLTDNSGGIGRTSLVLFDRVVFPVSTLLDKLFAERYFGKNLAAEAVTEG